MWAFFERLLDSSTLSPHGICLLWEPELIWLHVFSDAVIAASYFSIPFALAIVVSRRRDFQFGWIGWLFAAFITACGLTHVFSIYTLWVPVYGIEGLVKAVTAIASIATAAMLWPLIPKIIAIPSTSQLRQAYVALEEEGKQRRGAETLLQRFRETEATETQIRQAQKMEAIGQLTGGIAHDFNNLLTVITGTIEILADAVADRPELAEIAKLIDEAASRGAALTQHLLAFARKQPLRPTDVDVNALVVDTVKLLKPTLGELIAIDFTPGEDVPAALVDPSQLATALLNLALNARDAMPNGGRLELSAYNVEIDPQTAVLNRTLTPGRYVVLQVADNGAGIPQAIIDRIFEPFFTTKEVGQGTGLGLSTVLSIVRSHGGSVNVYSEPNQGSVFKVYLPAQPEVTTAGGSPNPADKFPRGRGELILVVDDEASIQDIVRQALETFGYRVATASDGAEAVALFAQRQSEIALVLTDMMMPVMDGLALIAALRRIKPDVLIVAGSGLNANAHVSRALNLGVNHFLAKPYAVDAMLQTFRKALAAPEN
jgi:signal transduction histidine kinase/CheY-like chemotaxis protein